MVMNCYSRTGQCYTHGTINEIPQCHGNSRTWIKKYLRISSKTGSNDLQNTLIGLWRF